ncbi:hypothetical protein Ahy_B04g069199 isoform D [Arachis hypogaea]|uniref:Uncharacterized protein n=1 Tax=Arachis hypogaea TaxID=3818 RepID=A0A444ZBW7_ARAHY|nr:hypothetical protein Ahy_B04g069199 isoform D [Arachis hypogaea]
MVIESPYVRRGTLFLSVGVALRKRKGEELRRKTGEERRGTREKRRARDPGCHRRTRQPRRHCSSSSLPGTSLGSSRKLNRAVFPHHRCHRRALSLSRKTPPLPLIEAAAREAKPLWSLKPKGVVTTAVPRARCCCCWVCRREESEQGKEEGGDGDLRC